MEEESKVVNEDFDNLIDNKKLRDENIRHIEVLNKVKELMMLPELNLMTMEQISTYYQVNKNTVEKCYHDNKEEINNDGTCLKRISEFRKLGYQTSETTRSYTVFSLPDNTTIKVNNRGLRCFTQRAVLRFGMLLRDSAVAREVRTQLLNIHQKATEEQKQSDINEELALRMEFGNAMVDNDPLKIFTAFTSLIDFKNRHIEKLEKENSKLNTTNTKLKNDNKALSGDILEWNVRDSLRKGVATLAYASNISIKDTWDLLYTEAYYKYKLNLRLRKKYQTATNKKKVSMLDLLRTETEWRMMVSSLAALCESQQVSVEWVFKEAKLSPEQMYKED
jgi:hypothetical protein